MSRELLDGRDLVAKLLTEHQQRRWSGVVQSGWEVGGNRSYGGLVVAVVSSSPLWSEFGSDASGCAGNVVSVLYGERLIPSAFEGS